MKKVVILRSTGIVEDSRTIKLAKELCENGFQVTVLGWDRKNQHKHTEEFPHGDKVINLKYFKLESCYGGGIKNVFKILKFQKWLKKEVKALPFGTIIHACDYDTGSAVYKLCKNRYKLVYDIFDFYADAHHIPFGLERFIRNKEIKIINQANCTIICTEQRVEQITGSKPKKLEVIHNTPNFDLKINNLKVNDRLKVCFIGALTPDRLLLEIVNEIPNHPELDFVFGGIGAYADEINQSVSNYKNVKFLGQMPYNNVLEVESKCDVLFATYNPAIKNHKFSAPNKFYEAGCLSKPIIVCENTGVDTLVKENKTGLVCEYDAKDFFRKVAILNENRDLLVELGKNGKKAYDEKFSWDIMRKRIIKLYNNL